MPEKNLPPLDLNQRYSINETCAYLRLSRPSVYQLINSGKLPVIPEGRRRFVPGTAIAERSRAPDQAA